MKINEMFSSLKYENMAADQITAAYFAKFRDWRKVELQKSDYTQLSDSPVTASDWATYRQALRDLPTVADFANAEVPEAPL
jgi:hypothetical protein